MQIPVPSTKPTREHEHTGQLTNQCTVINRDGVVVCTAQEPDGSTSWLGSIHGKCALGESLLTPTDEGLLCHRLADPAATAHQIDASDAFVGAEHTLLRGNDGVYTVTPHQIRLLQSPKWDIAPQRTAAPPPTVLNEPIDQYIQRVNTESMRERVAVWNQPSSALL